MFNKVKRDINFASVLAERENPGQMKARRSSNTVLLLCMVVVGAVLILLVMARNENERIVTQIDKRQEYLEDPVNVEMYDYKLQIQQRIARIKEYDEASNLFIKQLSESMRFESSWIDFYQNEMDTAVNDGSKIVGMTYSGRKLVLSCEGRSEESPKVFAKYMSERKKEDGTLMFGEVLYTGFSMSAEGIYTYTLELTLWQEEKAQ